MMKAGHSPNVVSFVVLVDELCEQKGVEEAKRVTGKLRQKGTLGDREFKVSLQSVDLILSNTTIDDLPPYKNRMRFKYGVNINRTWNVGKLRNA
ncbi:hypothetical protein TorRG33x02_355820 [Trema orientale]|uniref:Uncharacterized protein n=1 Tax=Trema orientale TaxID=63057 RepID=A0A2P5A8P5_TREOI|nr:hypothetical protein TorRG33x02_355820 [Trema orientale]